MMDHMQWWNSEQPSVKLELDPAPTRTLQPHLTSPVLGGGPLMVTIPKSPCNLRLPSSSSAMRVGSAGSPLSTPSPVSTPSPSPKSPSSWHESFQELSRSLQQICGSPTKELSSPGLTHTVLRRGNSCGPKLTTSPVSPIPGAGGLGTGTGRHSLPPALNDQSQQQFTETTSQCSPPPPQPCPELRHLLVRHEESEQTLKKKLEAIWQGSHSSGDESDPQDNTPDTAPARRSKYATRRESVCGCFRAQVSLQNHPLDFISVGVDRKTLRVVSWRHPNSAVTLLETKIPSNIDLEKLDCYVQDGAVFVKERSRKRLHIGELSGHRETCVVYLPIIWEDTKSRQVKIVQHVPKELGQFQLQVKTIDERLVVSTKVTAESLHQPRPQSYPPPNLTVGACFSRIMQLPDRVHPRSVSAAVSNTNQLIIWGNLAAGHGSHS